ncbi:MAG: hypothetical protein SF172_03225 [Burkholderiales bacterium]|nr:hypothetical protein [Burkholderiales bacterium]
MRAPHHQLISAGGNVRLGKLTAMTRVSINALLYRDALAGMATRIPVSGAAAQRMVAQSPPE